MKKNINNRMKNLCLILLILSITCLMLNSILPMFKVNNYGPKDESIYFNLESAKKIADEEDNGFNNVINRLQDINLLLWTVTILIILSFFGIIFYSSKKYKKFTTIFIYFGLPVVFLNGLIFSLYLFLLIYVIDSIQIFLAYIFDPLRYSYLPAFILLLLLIFSLVYFVLMIKFILNSLKKHKKQEKIKKEEPQKTKKDDKVKNLKLVISDKKDENTKKESVNDKEIFKKKEDEKPVEDIKIKDTDKDDEETDIEKKEKVDDTEITEDKPIDKTEEKENIEESNDNEKEGESIEEIIKREKPDQSIESALDNAIMKRKKNMKIEKKEKTEKYKIKCPKCSHIFEIDKVEGKNKIKCPECGEEGIIEL